MNPEHNGEAEANETVNSAELLGQLSRIEVSLDQVYLDPNNPRFGDTKEKKETHFTEEALQQRAVERLERDVGIGDLIKSIQVNGFLPVDAVVVREIGPNRYVVVEGNRRICAMKRLHADHVAHEIELQEPVFKSISRFQALAYKGDDPEIAWRIQGLRHILGIKAWGPLQEAMSLEKRLTQLRRSHPGKGRPPGLPSVARQIGVSPSKAATLVRSLRAFNQAKSESELGDRLTQEHFSIFSEAIFKREALQGWLKWKDEDGRFEDMDHLDRLLEWLLPQQENGKELPPRIRRVNPDLRDILPQIIHDPAMLARFEAGELSMEGAQVELQTKVIQATPEELESYIRRLDELAKTIDTLPLPRIAQSGRGAVFVDKLGQILTSIEMQQKLIGIAAKPTG
jgi:hypothetical protein